MHTFSRLNGVYGAAVTPLHTDDTLALEDVLPLLRFLARRGVHGALLMGTTGEGPSFSPQERFALLQEAVRIREEIPAFRLLMGTGTPSLEETIQLTKEAFDLGVDGVVVLPPYYYRSASDSGLFAWFSRVLQQAVPNGGAFLGYHIPPVSGVALTFDLLARLKDAFPNKFAGIKDSSADPEHACRLGERFGSDLVVFSGTDNLFSLALENHASGCITAMANVLSNDLRIVWDSFQRGDIAAAQAAQERLNTGRAIFKNYPPNPSLYKALLSRLHGFSSWAVRPPLLPLTDEKTIQAIAEAQSKIAGFAD